MDHALSKLRAEHLLLSPLLVPFRIAHQLPIIYDNAINGYDVDIPASKRETSRVVKPSDQTFFEGGLNHYQVMCIRFNRKEFPDLYKKMPMRIREWAFRHFKNEKAIKIATAANKTDILNTLHSTPIRNVLGRYDHIIYIIPEECDILAVLDHYTCDGGILFDMVKSFFNTNVSRPPFPKYQYIPFVSEAMDIEYAFRTGMNYLEYPSQIKRFKHELDTSSKIIKKSDMDGKWDRWHNYAECILNIFERFEGNEDALGEPFHVIHGGQSLPVSHTTVPSHLYVFITIGIDTDVSFGNNRIGGINVSVKCPHRHLERKYRREYVASQIEIQCTEHFTDALVSYDVLRGFNTGWLRKLFSDNINVVLTSFKVPLIHRGGFGGFMGSASHPHMYVNSMTDDTATNISYSTNWF